MAVNIDRELNGSDFTPTQVLVLTRVLNAVITDVGAQRTAITTITAKLDGENVTNLDTDYAATADPAALTLET